MSRFLPLLLVLFLASTSALAANQFAVAFSPIDSSTVTVNGTDTAQRVAITTDGNTLRVHNQSSHIVYVQWGDSAVTASVSYSVSIGPGAVEVFDGQATGYVSVVFPNGSETGKVLFTKGFGR